MRVPWKVVGLAGLAGVAATGAVVARWQREHVEVTPDELRERLRARLAEADGGDAETPPPDHQRPAARR